jgi:hypothetical protein
MIRDEALHFFLQIKSPLPMGTRTSRVAHIRHLLANVGMQKRPHPNALALALSLPERLRQFQFPFLLAPHVSLLSADQIAATHRDEDSIYAFVAHSAV